MPRKFAALLMVAIATLLKGGNILLTLDGEDDAHHARGRSRRGRAGRSS